MLPNHTTRTVWAIWTGFSAVLGSGDSEVRFERWVSDEAMLSCPAPFPVSQPESEGQHQHPACQQQDT